MHRLAAALISLTAFAGLAIQFQATLAQSGSALATAVILLRYLTVITNLLVAVTFALLAIRGRISPFWLGCLTLAIMLVGIVYWLLLRGLLELSGGALMADALLHTVVPILVPLYWLMAAPKGQLRWRDPWLWSTYPSVYLVYALVRGRWEGGYAYPFIAVDTLGLARTIGNSLAIALGFVVAGIALVAIDSALARRGRNRTMR